MTCHIRWVNTFQSEICLTDICIANVVKVGRQQKNLRNVSADLVDGWQTTEKLTTKKRVSICCDCAISLF